MMEGQLFYYHFMRDHSKCINKSTMINRNICEENKLYLFKYEFTTIYRVKYIFREVYLNFGLTQH